MRTETRIWFNKNFSSIHGVLRQLRADWENGLVLIGTHTDLDSPPLAECSVVEREPDAPVKADYIKWALDFCRRQRVDVFVPGRMRATVADHRASFEAVGTRLIVAGDGPTLRLLEDKGRFLEQIPPGVRVHRFYRAKTWTQFEAAANALEKEGLNVCIKPASSTFGLGFHILDESMTPLKRLLSSEAHIISKAELRGILSAVERFPELLVMEYLDGSEFSVDVLAESGDVQVMVCRRKPMSGKLRIAGSSKLVHVNEGQSQILAREPEIELMVRVLVKHFQLGGLLNVQFRARAEHPERPHLLEINGRMSGGLPYIGLCGLNLLLLAVKAALREPGTPPPVIPEPRLPLRVQDRSEVFVRPRHP